MSEGLIKKHLTPWPFPGRAWAWLQARPAGDRSVPILVTNGPEASNDELAAPPPSAA